MRIEGFKGILKQADAIELNLEGRACGGIEFGRKRMWLNRIWKIAAVAESNLEGSGYG